MKPMSPIWKVLHGFVTAVSCLAVTVQPVLAQGIVSDGGVNGPDVLTAPNGTQMVMITTPNAAGVSQNTYGQFDISEAGAILNNVAANYANTALAGYVPGNANLAGGAASLIINEVTAPNPSQLLGYLEVAGTPAGVIIANPYGITCDGCGFLSTDAVTLTTGEVLFAPTGAVDRISVMGGLIAIGERGLDARGVSQFDLISRQATFAGSVHGERVRVIAGQNDVIFSTGEIVENGGDGSAAPTLAIDSTVFGGMYAGKITIVSTEDGVGVRAPEQMASSSAGMTITADGRLVIGSATSQGAMTARSTSNDVVVNGTVVTGGALSLEAARDLMVEADAIIVAEAAADLIAGQTLTVGQDAQVVAADRLVLEAAADLILQDRAVAGSLGGLGLSADQVTLETGSEASAGGNLVVESAGLANAGTVTAAGALVLEGIESFDNTGGTLSSQTGIQMGFVGPQVLTATTWGDVTTDGWLRLQGAGDTEMAALTIAAGTEVLATDQLTVLAGSVTNAGTLASTDGTLLVQASADILNTGLLFAGGDLLALRSGGTITNDGGVILAASDLLVCGVSSADCTTNPAGDRAGALINSTWTDGTTYRPGVIETLGGNMIIAADLIRNERVGPATVTESDPFDETSRTVGRDTCSTLFCLGDDSDYYYKEWTYKILTSVDLEGPAAQLVSGGDMYLIGGDINNDYGLISAAGDIALLADSVTNAGVVTGTTAYRDTQDWFYDDVNILSGGNRDYPIGPIVTSSTFAPDQTFFGVIEAGGSITGTVIDSVINTSVTAGVTTLSTTPSIAPGLDAGTTTGPIDLSALGNDQLFVTDPGVTGGYLIETRPEFIDLSQFISSDYFLGSLEFDPDITQTRLGDAFVETYLIRNQIAALTGGRVLDPTLSEREQLRAMYDNAIDAAADLALRPGVTLTPEQIAALTTDIIWLEETIVNGQTVLVPRVYLGASGGAGALLDPARISATTIALDVGSLTNSGSLTSLDDLIIAAAGDITNAGGQMSAAALLRLNSAQGDLVNLSGQIMGGTVEIAAQNIFSETDLVRVYGADGYQDIPAPSALITATSGTLALNAAGDIVVTGGDLAGNAGITLLAGGDVTLGALTLEGSYDATGDGWRFQSISQQQLVSSLTSETGDILIRSTGVDAGGAVQGGDIRLEGTQVAAAGAINMTAYAGEIVLGAAQDITSTSLQAQSEGPLGGSWQLSDQSLSVTNQVSNLQGSSINILAAGDVTDQASEMTATTGDLTLSSVFGDVSLASVTDIEARNRSEETVILGGFMDFASDLQSLDVMAQGITGDAAGDIALQAGGDLELQGGSLSAGGTLTTTVGGETRVLATVDTDFDALITRENNSLLVIDTTEVTLEQVAAFPQLQAAGGVALDETSPVTIGLVDAQAAFGASAQQLTSTGAATGDVVPAMAIVDYFLPDATGSPQGAVDQDAGAGVETDGGPSDPSDPAYDFEGSLVDVVVPGAADGAGYAYLNTLQDRESTIVEEMALIQHAYRDQNVEVGVVGNLIIAYVSGQIVGVFELGSVANAMAISAVSGTIEGVVTGDLDVKALLTNVAFAGVSSYATSAFDLSSYMDLGEDAGLSLITGKQGGLSLNGIANQFGDSVISAGLTSTVYGTDFADNFTNSFRSGLVMTGLADVQGLIGDKYNLKDENGNPIGSGEGSLGHVLTHAVAGCGAAELLGGNCAAGAVGSATGALLSGYFEDNPIAADPNLTAQQQEVYRLKQEQMLTNFVAGVATAITSGGDAQNTQLGASIGTSTVANNRQLHSLEIMALEDKARELAGQGGLTEEEWRARLAQEAMRTVDARWALEFDADPVAAAILSELNAVYGEEFANLTGGQLNFLQQDQFYNYSAVLASTLIAEADFYDATLDNWDPVYLPGAEQFGTASENALVLALRQSAIENLDSLSGEVGAGVEWLDPTDGGKTVADGLALLEVRQSLMAYNNNLIAQQAALIEQGETVPTDLLSLQAGTQTAMASALMAESGLLFQGSRSAIGQAAVEAFQGLGDAALMLGGAAWGNDQATADVLAVLGDVQAILSDPGSVPPAIAAQLENTLIAANVAYQNGDFETAGKLVGELQLVTVGMVTGVGAVTKLGDNLTDLAHKNTVDATDLVPQIRPVATSPLPDDWVPPSGYVKTSDGTVVHVETGQVYTPMRGADGALRTTTAGDPVFETQSAGATAQTTLTQDATSGQAIELGAPNRILTTNVPTSGRKFNQLTSRGWDQSSIDNVVNSPVHTSTATNRATGNPATAYFDSSSNYVVRDNVTGDIVQMSNRNDPNWIPDPSITDPYIP